MRHLPQGSTKWHPATDRLVGSDVYGNPGDDFMAWSIEF